MERNSARYEMNLSRVICSESWIVLFPLRIGECCYVIDEESWRSLHRGSNVLTDEITSAAVGIVHLFERLGIDIQMSPFRPETENGLTYCFPERADVVRFALAERRDVAVYLVQGNMYHGYTFKQLFSCPVAMRSRHAYR